MNRFFIFAITIVIVLTNCTPKDRPKDSFVLEKALEGEKIAQPDIVLTKKINLDEEPDLEVLYLVRNANSEILIAFKKKGDSWETLWMKKYSLLNLGPLAHSLQENKWVAVQEPEKKEGYIVKKILLEELPGDNFNSVFIEMMSEEPPLGLFSVPMGYRKGKKILDGLAVLKDHPTVKATKRSEFEYKAKDKSILVFPKDRNLNLEFVYNGFEMIPNLSSQPIPSIIKLENTNNKYRIEFKNRGGFNTNTYITLSFPQGGKAKGLSDTGVKAYNKGDSVYSKTRDKYIPASYPMVEATKPSWGSNVRYAFEFEYDCQCELKDLLEDLHFLFRISYRYNRQVEMIPNEFSIYPEITSDQQGFPAYKLLLPK
ncbi:MAG: hypothetical protein JJT78_01345 [Leptospira sp.]|nr:hypothetical protein [Leptospira sp.]